VFPMRQFSHVRLQSRQGASVQNANRVGAQDARYNERPVYTALLLTGYQIDIRRGAMSFLVSSGFTKQNFNL
jgi:hypothetical protein